MQKSSQAMEEFLASVERRAFRMAYMATGSTEEALDIVQDAMFRLVRWYAEKPEDKWKPLFFRILQNRIRDWYRRRAVRNRWHAWLPSRGARGAPWDSGERAAADPIALMEDKGALNPHDQAAIGRAIQAIDAALGSLPLRQRQAFLLRAWEGLSVRETASAMNCSEGTVKAHYSRAVHTLRSLLEDHWP